MIVQRHFEDVQSINAILSEVERDIDDVIKHTDAVSRILHLLKSIYPGVVDSLAEDYT